MQEQKVFSTPAGFEPTRDEPNGFQVHRLNHSATVSFFQVIKWDNLTINIKVKHSGGHFDI